MAKFNYGKYKIIISPESVKTMGLKVGDIVRREYRDNNTLFYSLVLVLETGIDTVGNNSSSYFIGALLEGDEPKNNELLDFVRVTSLTSKERGGAIYLTATDSDSPYMDVVDGLGFEHSLLSHPEKTHLTSDLTLPIQGSLTNPEMVLVAYRIRASRYLKAQVSIRYSDEVDGSDEVVVTTQWQYQLTAIHMEYPEQYARELHIAPTLADDDWCEIKDINVVRLADIATLTNATKIRIGKITGLIDPTFGKLEGYGSYFQNLYATGNVNIAGTITAGDSNGSASTFYAGRIHKNVIVDSLGCNFTDAVYCDEQSPSGVGGVVELTAASRLLVQSAEWRTEHIGSTYTFSIWLKPELDATIPIYQDEHFIGNIQATARIWQRYKLTFTLKHSANDALYIGIEQTNCKFSAPQLEQGEYISQYQPTDNTLSYTDDYGAWFNKGGIGGTIQNPLLRLNADGSISSGEGSFVINPDGTGHLASGSIAWTKDKVTLADGIFIEWGTLSPEAQENLREEAQSAVIPDWVSDWNSNKTVIDSTSLITPKIFAGIKNDDNTITGVAIGHFSLTTKTESGELETEVINGIYGYNNGVKTFSIDSTGSVELGLDKQSIRYNALTGKVEFGEEVALAWVGATYIDKDGIFTGSLSAKTINTINLSATQITTGTLSADRIQASSIGAEKLDANSIKANIINTSYINGLSCTFDKGTIGGWIIESGALSGTNISLSNAHKRIVVYGTTSSPTSGHRTQLFYNSNTDFGFYSTDQSGTCVVRLGSSNSIAGWTIDTTKIYKGSVYLGADGSIYNSTKWKLGADGSGSLANGNISWDSSGNVTFSPQVSMQWQSPINSILPKLTHITSTGIYTGTLSADQINALSLTTTKGTIGGWVISSASITKNSVSLNSDGSITNGTKWKLNNDGSGSLANGNISWDSSGNVAFSSSVSLNWQNVAYEGLIYARGTGLNNNNARQVIVNSNVVREDWSRGLALVVLYRNSLEIVSNEIYDTYAGSTYCDSLTAKLNSLTSDKLVILTSYDAITINETLNVAIQRCGGSDITIASLRMPYAMIGIPGIGKNKGLVVTTGATSTDPYAELTTKVYNGIPQGINANSQLLTNISGNGIYTGTLSADQVNALSLTTTKGTIGGWTISSTAITKNSISLSSDGSITNGYKWALNNDGSGSLASGNISWDMAGNITARNATFSNVRINGSLRSPYVLNAFNINLGGSSEPEIVNYDNVVIVQSGGWQTSTYFLGTLAIAADE